MEIGETLYVNERSQWRDWLERHHANKNDIWLIYHAKATGVPTIPYNDAVEEALCFGWIDSIVKKHGPASRAQRFSPRRPGSPFSEMNKVRLRRLNEAGLLLPASLENVADIIDEPFTVPEDILFALRQNEIVWRNFQAFPDSYQRIRIGFIDGARRRPDIFQQRLDYFIRKTAQNKRFGMVQYEAESASGRL